MDRAVAVLGGIACDTTAQVHRCTQIPADLPGKGPVVNPDPSQRHAQA